VKGFLKSSDSKAEFHAEVEIHSMIEYNETNGVVGFQQGADQIVTQIAVKDLNFDPIVCTTETAGFRCILSSTNGEISCTAFVANSFSNFSGSLQSPSAVKFSVNISKADKKDGDFLALEARVRVQSEFKNEVEGRKGTEKHLQFGPTSFTWIEKAEVENRTAIVISSTPTVVPNDDSKDADDEDDDVDTECKAIFFSFIDSGKGIVFWDPSLAYDAALARASSAFHVIPSIFLLMSLFALLF
jgi:hypothetical protein